MIATVARGVSALAFADLGVLGGAVGAFTGDLLRVRRAHVEHAMARAGVDAPAETARGMYASLGTSFLEALWLTGARRELGCVARFDAAARGVLAEVRTRGVVLAASHTGNWEISSCSVAQIAPLLVVTKHLSVGWVDAFWQAARGRYGVSFASASGAFEAARRHVHARGMVAMMIDQVPLRRTHAMELPFLGAPAWVDRAPAMLAARTGALYAVPVARRRNDGTQEILVLEAIAPPRRATRAWVDDTTARATACLERFILANPTEWLWMHRRWKAPPS
jgi:KDO2-lipid IV(A) lauroyltransferase